MRIRTLTASRACEAAVNPAETAPAMALPMPAGAAPAGIGDVGLTGSTQFRHHHHHGGGSRTIITFGGIIITTSEAVPGPRRSRPYGRPRIREAWSAQWRCSSTVTRLWPPS